MKTQFNSLNPFKLTDAEIHELCIYTGTYDKNADQQTIDEWKNAYRAVENEHNQQIEKYGDVEKWYESGEGRLL